MAKFERDAFGAVVGRVVEYDYGKKHWRWSCGGTCKKRGHALTEREASAALAAHVEGDHAGY